MKMIGLGRVFLIVCWNLGLSAMAIAGGPVITVSSPPNGSDQTSPVHYAASATSPGCAKGIAATRIYTGPNVSAFTVQGGRLDANVAFGPGFFNTVVEAWDNCGGVASTPINITVASANLAPPTFLYDAEFSTGKVAGFTVNPTTGALTPIAQSPVWAHWGPVGIASDKGGFRLYVANQGSQDLNAYFINRHDGSLAPVPGSPFESGGTGTNVAVAPSGKFVYVTTDSSHGGSDGVSGFKVDANGSLLRVPGSPFFAGTMPGSIAIDPAGKYVFVGHESSASPDAYAINVFSINQVDGSLTSVPGEPFAITTPSECYLCGGGGVYDLKTDLSGNYLFAPVSGDGTVAVFRVDRSTGSLSPATGSPFVLSLPDSPTAPGAEPDSITVDPNNLYVYVDIVSGDADGDVSRNAIAILSLNSSTGALAGATDFTVPQDTCNQNNIRTDPSGKFLYVVGESGCEQFAGSPTGPGVILGLSKQSKPGTLTPLPGSPFSVQDDPVNSTDRIIVTP